MALTMMVVAPIMGLGGVAMALHEGAKLSTLLLVALPVMGAFLSVVMVKVIPKFRSMQVKIDRLNEVLREQITRNPANAPVAEEAGRHIARLEQGQTVAKEEINPLLLPLFAPQVQGFLIDAMARDPARLAGETVLPMLIVQGGSDLQVALADGQALAAARPDARLLVLDGVSHTLKRVEGEGLSANYRTYFDTALPLDPRVVDAVAEFMQQGSAAPADRAGMRRTR
ncbi:MAG: hypothetical protein B7X57_01740 [Erythrobacter sp. 34-65-8]|nr:MAG: hypothetical protein B7X57_01740 [Erythrobacter sp. 34-65-8]